MIVVSVDMDAVSQICDRIMAGAAGTPVCGSLVAGQEASATDSASWCGVLWSRHLSPVIDQSIRTPI